VFWKKNNKKKAEAPIGLNRTLVLLKQAHLWLHTVGFIEPTTC